MLAGVRFIAGFATEVTLAACEVVLEAIRDRLTAGRDAAASSLSVALATEDAAKVPELGQALAASSVPVVLTAIQVAQLAQESGGNLAATATNTGTLAGVVTSGAALTKPKAGLSYNSAALERSCVASAVAASPAMARMWNAGASSRFLQGHDANSLPGNGAIPNDVVNAGATSPCFINYVCPSDAYGTGVVFACSTTAASLTITGANDALFSIVLFPSES